HYRLPAIFEEHHNEALTSEMELLKQAGFGGPDAKGDWPPGVSDLGDGRIAAMDDAGVDVQILSHTVPGPETLDPTPAVELSKEANDAVAAAVARHPDRLRGSPPCRCETRRALPPNSNASSTNTGSSA